MRSPLRLAVAALLTGLILGLGGGCGEPKKPGGTGRLEAASEGGVSVLRVSGSPYEMGWWQGYRLRNRILELHAAWEAALFEALIGKPRVAEGARGAREALERHCELCLDQTLHRLPERMLQELDGMASGCGLAKEQLLRIEVMRDALRMKGLEARLTGAVGLQRQPGLEYEAQAWWSGPDAALLDSNWLVVVRSPEDGPETAVLAWPGSLGGVAGLRADGQGFLCAEAQVSEARRRGFGGGRPFDVGARQALEEADNAYDLIAQVTGTMGNAMVAFSLMYEGEHAGVHSMGAFQVYGYPDPPWVPGRSHFLAVGPYERVDGPEAVALQEAVGATDIEPQERWLRLRGHADPSGTAQGELPGVRIAWRDRSGTFEVTLPGGRTATVRMGQD